MLFWGGLGGASIVYSSQKRRCGQYIWMRDSASIMYTSKGLPKLQRASFSKTLTCHMTLARSEPPLSPRESCCFPDKTSGDGACRQSHL